MPLLDELLLPIPGENPSGVNLQYEQEYADVREARREEDDTSQGVWQHSAKKADYALVAKLAVGALRTKTKDLQIAAFLVESMTYQDGLAGLENGLALVRGLLDNFWDTVYPELEDGDAEMRAVPLSFIGRCVDRPLKEAPITETGLSWLEYKRSRMVPGENEYDDVKRQLRADAIADGRLTPEEFEESFEASSKRFYQDLEAQLSRLKQTVRELNDYCADKFQDVAPDFQALLESLDELYAVVHVLLVKKRELDPDPVELSEAADPEQWAWNPAPATPAAPAGPATAQTAPVRLVSALAQPEPVDRDDASNRIATICAFLRRNDPNDPTPYLVIRGLRWGELRGAGADASSFESPPTEIRQRLRKLWLASDWSELLDASEAAMALPCGRAWLDLQAFAVRACEESGRTAVANAILAELRGLLADFPRLIDELLLDGTPAANPETQNWLRQTVLPRPEAPQAQPQFFEAPSFESAEPVVEAGHPAPPETYELALEAARSGRAEEAIELLSHRPAEETTGRARFQRRVQLAQICMSTGHEDIAHPILEELAAEIDERQLERWESEDVIAYPLSLLYQCVEKLHLEDSEAKRLYARICRLNPVQALALAGR